MKNIVITGPTCSGKTATAVELSEIIGGEIVSADSRQVYRHMDIGTAMPSRADRRRVPHHLVGFLEPDRVYTAADYRRGAEKIIAEIKLRNRRPVIAGGTGLYIKALVEGIFSGPGCDPAFREALEEKAAKEGPGSLHSELSRLDPERASKIHPHDKRRVIRALEIHKKTGALPSSLRRWENENHEFIIIALAPPVNWLYQAINNRVERMFEQGFVEEVRALIAMGCKRHFPSMEAVGYREIMDYLEGVCSLEEAGERIKSATRRYAKRQLTWIRGNRKTAVLEAPPGGGRPAAEKIISLAESET